MCDQIPVKVCEQLTLDELIALETLHIERSNVKKPFTIAVFLKGILDDKTRRGVTPNDRVQVLCEMMRRTIGTSPHGLPPGVRRLTSKDLLRLGYGCRHDAD